MVQTEKAKDSRTTTWETRLDGLNGRKDYINSSTNWCVNPCRFRGSEELEHTMTTRNALGR